MSNTISIMMNLKDGFTPALDGLRSGLTATELNFKSFKGTAMSIKSTMAGLAGAFAVKEMFSFGKDLYNAYKVAQKPIKDINKVIYATLAPLGATQTQMDGVVNSYINMAKGLQSSGVANAKFIESGMAVATQLGLTHEQVLKLTPSMNDYILKQKGMNATSEDYAETNRTVALAVTKGSAKALFSLGIVMDDTEKKMFKNANAGERVAMIQQKMAQMANGTNEAMAKTPEGQMRQMEVQMDSLKETLGQSIATVFVPLANEWLPKINNELKYWSDVIAGVQAPPTEGWGDIVNNVERLSPLLIPIVASITAMKAEVIATSVASAWGTIVSAVGNIGTAFKTLNLIIMANPYVALAVVVITVVSLIIANWDLIRTKISSVWDSITQFGSDLMDSVPAWWDKVTNSVVEAIQSWGNSFGDFIDSAFSKIGELASRLNPLKGIMGSFGSSDGGGEPTADNNALGTSYFGGGYTHINENNRGEIVKLPNGTEVIPHDVVMNSRDNAPNVSVSVNIGGNIIGNEEYADYIGNHVWNTINNAMNNM